MNYKEVRKKIQDVLLNGNFNWGLDGDMKWLKEYVVEEDAYEWQDHEYLEYILKIDEKIYKLFIDVSYESDIDEITFCEVEKKEIITYEYEALSDELDLYEEIK